MSWGAWEVIETFQVFACVPGKAPTPIVCFPCPLEALAHATWLGSGDGGSPDVLAYAVALVVERRWDPRAVATQDGQRAQA